jgi:5-methylcytosine-specific restriction endonuclease McrA
MAATEAQKVATRKWYAANREKVAEINRQEPARTQRLHAVKRYEARNPTRRKEYKAANREAITEQNKEYYRRRGQFVIRMREYGLTQEHFEAMLQSQGNSCAICGLQFGGGGKGSSPHVDHDHDTGRVRALLCNNCNFLIGYCREEPATLLSAARYLQAQKEA